MRPRTSRSAIKFVKVATADQANLVLGDGKNLTYLAWAADYADGWDEKATKVVLPFVAAAKRACATDYAADATASVFYELNDTLYVACELGDEDFIFNVDGVAVAAKVATNGDEYVNIGHEYAFEFKTNNYNEFEVTKVFCADCDKTFKFVVSPQELTYTTFGAGNYETDADELTLTNGTSIWVERGGKTISPGDSSSSTSTDKVESAATFDVGIAMHVGMSVLAATGSAVVIGKRKD